MTVTDLLEPRNIHLHFAAASVIEAIPLLLEPALMPRLRDPQVVKTIIDAVVMREGDTSTMCGTVSLPHTRSASVDGFVLTLGANAEGTIAGHRNPRLIFAFVSPDGKREQHLQLLASLAKLSQNAAIVDQMATAASPDQVIALLRGAGL